LLLQLLLQWLLLVAAVAATAAAAACRTSLGGSHQCGSQLTFNGPKIITAGC